MNNYKRFIRTFQWRWKQEYKKYRRFGLKFVLKMTWLKSKYRLYEKETPKGW